MLSHSSGRFLEGIKQRHNFLKCYEIVDIILRKGLSEKLRTFSTTFPRTCSEKPKDAYVSSPLCPPPGGIYTPDPKNTLKCPKIEEKKDSKDASSKPAEKIVCTSAKGKPDAPPPEQATSDCGKSESVKKHEKPPSKPQAKKVGVPQHKKSKTNIPMKKTETKKSCVGKSSDNEEGNCSTLPWPLNLFSKGKSKPHKSKPDKNKKGEKCKGEGKKKMVSISNETVPDIFRFLSSPHTLLQTLPPWFGIRSFHNTAQSYGDAICPAKKEMPCDKSGKALKLSPESERRMVILRAIARKRRQCPSSKCIITPRDTSLAVMPTEGWDGPESVPMVRDDAVIKASKSYNPPTPARPIPRKLRKNNKK